MYLFCFEEPHLAILKAYSVSVLRVNSWRGSGYTEDQTLLSQMQGMHLTSPSKNIFFKICFIQVTSYCNMLYKTTSIWSTFQFITENQILSFIKPLLLLPKETYLVLKICKYAHVCSSAIQSSLQAFLYFIAASVMLGDIFSPYR